MVPYAQFHRSFLSSLPTFRLLQEKPESPKFPIDNLENTSINPPFALFSADIGPLPLEYNNIRGRLMIEITKNR